MTHNKYCFECLRVMLYAHVVKIFVYTVSQFSVHLIYISSPKVLSICYHTWRGTKKSNFFFFFWSVSGGDRHFDEAIWRSSRIRNSGTHLRKLNFFPKQYYLLEDVLDIFKQNRENLTAYSWRHSPVWYLRFPNNSTNVPLTSTWNDWVLSVVKNLTQILRSQV